MEDDFVGKIFKHAEKLKDHYKLKNMIINKACYRVHCDPYKLPEDFKKYLQDGGRHSLKKFYIIQDYIDAIIWGASGFETAYLTPSAGWQLDVSVPIDRDDSSYFYFVKNNEGNNMILDPFWREIATDFLTDIIEKKAFTKEFTGADEEKDKMVVEAKSIKRALKDWKVQRNLDGVVISEPLDLGNGSLSALGNLRLQLKVFVEKFLETNKLKIDGSSNYKIWIRKESWMGNEEQTLDDLRIDSCIDRAFYVSTNVPALKTNGERRIQEIHALRLSAASTAAASGASESKDESAEAAAAPTHIPSAQILTCGINAILMANPYQCPTIE